MAKEVILTPIAVNDFENVVDYLTHKWGIPTANNFVDRFEKVVLLLSEDVSMFPFVNTAKQIQKCILTKHNILYFKETVEAVKILTIFDTRQGPEKLIRFFDSLNQSAQSLTPASSPYMISKALSPLQ